MVKQDCSFYCSVEMCPFYSSVEILYHFENFNFSKSDLERKRNFENLDEKLVILKIWMNSNEILKHCRG